MDLTGKPFDVSAQKTNRKKILDFAQKIHSNARVLKAIN